MSSINLSEFVINPYTDNAYFDTEEFIHAVKVGVRTLDKLIDEAEDKSLTVCEDCGSEENVGMRLTGWYTTMCLDCLKKEVKERNYPQRWRRNSDDKLFWVNIDGTLEEINEEEQK